MLRARRRGSSDQRRSRCRPRRGCGRVLAGPRSLPDAIRKPRSARLPHSEPCSSARACSSGRPPRQTVERRQFRVRLGLVELGLLEGAERVDALPRSRPEVPDRVEQPAVEVALRPQERRVEPATGRRTRRSPRLPQVAVRARRPERFDHALRCSPSAARRAPAAAPGRTGRRPAPCWMSAGCRSASTRQAKDPGSLLRITGAS